MTTIGALNKALDDGPWLTLLALADLHEEQGDEWKASGYRWLEKCHKKPFVCEQPAREKGSRRFLCWGWKIKHSLLTEIDLYPDETALAGVQRSAWCRLNRIAVMDWQPMMMTMHPDGTPWRSDFRFPSVSSAYAFAAEAVGAWLYEKEHGKRTEKRIRKLSHRITFTTPME